MDVLTGEYDKPGSITYRQVDIDTGKGTITFHRCHTPNGFYVFGPEPEYTCKLEELRGICFTSLKGIGTVWEIVTPNGRGRIPEAMSHSEPIMVCIRDAIEKSGNRLKWTEYPAAKIIPMILIVPIAVFGGLALFVSEIIPHWLTATLLLTPLACVLVLPIMAWWNGKSTW